MDNSKKINIKLINRPGNIIRIALVLERRAYTIQSLNVYTLNESTNYAEMQLEVKGDTEKFEQIKKQLSKLIDVIEVAETSRKEEAIPAKATSKVIAA